MAEGDKTEQPTPRKLDAARKRGEVARSRDLSAALGGLAVVLALAGGGSAWFGRLVVYMRAALTRAVAEGPVNIPAAFLDGLGAAAVASLPALGAAAAVAILAGLIQTGALISFTPVVPDLARAAPQVKRLVSLSSWMDLAKGLLAATLTGAVAWSTVRGWLPSLAHASGATTREVAMLAGTTLTALGERLAFVALALGVADFLWQRARLRRSLRMTREEVKREFKDAEGDPRHKAERRRAHRELLEQRMLESVRKADFVVVNPDHIAVAIRYERDGGGAPVVVAKGERLIAERIKEIAREAGVPIFRDVTLARSLRDVEEGDQIPEALYEAVAEILRVVYGLQTSTAPAQSAPGGDPEPGKPAAPLERPGPGWTRA